MRKLFTLLVAAVLAASWFGWAGAPVARADATFIVNDTADVVDFSPGDGVCETASGNGICTLRAAVMEANALGGTDTIVLPVGTFVLAGAASEDGAVTGDLDLSSDMTINGSSAAGTTLVGTTDRVIHILNNANVNINNVTVRDGSVAGNGGGILLDSGTLNLSGSAIGNGGSNSAANGGGLYQAGGTLNITATTFENNFASGNGGGLYQAGGALTIHRSTFDANTTAGAGGGLYVPGGVTATVNNSTFSGNSSAGVGVTAGGGGLFVSGTVNLNSVTIADNAATNAGGGVMQLGGTVNLRNTLIGGGGSNANTAGTGPDCSGTLTSLGYNLIESLAGCSGIANGVNNDIAGVDPLLNGLGSNGGLTQTHSLQSGSPAVETGNPGGCGDGGASFSTDQRGPGFARHQDANTDGMNRCDIGAYDLAPTITVTPSMTFTPSQTPTPTITNTSAPTETPTLTHTPAPTATITQTPMVTATPIAGGKLPPATVAPGTGGGGTGGGGTSNGASVTLTVAALQTLAAATPTNTLSPEEADLTSTASAGTAIAQAPTLAPPTQIPTITPTFSLPADDVSLSTSRIIGTDGGVLTCGIWYVGVQAVTVPENSVFRCETISPEQEAQARLPLNHRAFWHIVDVTASDAGGQALSRFNPPLAVCAYYADSYVDAVGGDLSRLVIYTSEGANRPWTALTTTAQDGVPRVCAESDRLSLFRLVAQPSPLVGRLTSPTALIITGAVCLLMAIVLVIVIWLIARRARKPKPTEALSV